MSAFFSIWAVFHAAYSIHFPQGLITNSLFLPIQIFWWQTKFFTLIPNEAHTAQCLVNKRGLYIKTDNHYVVQSCLSYLMVCVVSLQKHLEWILLFPWTAWHCGMMGNGRESRMHIPSRNVSFLQSKNTGLLLMYRRSFNVQGMACCSCLGGWK